MLKNQETTYKALGFQLLLQKSEDPTWGHGREASSSSLLYLGRESFRRRQRPHSLGPERPMQAFGLVCLGVTV